MASRFLSVLLLSTSILSSVSALSCGVGGSLNQLEQQEIYPCSGQAQAIAACQAQNAEDWPCASVAVGDNVCFTYTNNVVTTLGQTGNLVPGWTLLYYDVGCPTGCPA